MSANLPACHHDSPQHAAYVARVEELEAEGCDTSDAQGIADMEFDGLLTQPKKPTKQNHKMKTTNLHTPSPWKIGGKFDPDQIGFGAGYIEIEGRILCDRDGYTTEANVAKVMCAGMSHRKEDEANARLIAAAPDLAEALEFLLADYIAIDGENLTGSTYPADKARAALCKITPEEAAK